ncbi:MAG: hypothetical protein QOI91_1841 [Solirubrobacteraceae bacterium]|nr:hypothetical protein [Solirubrobacteraceae bacterium]
MRKLILTGAAVASVAFAGVATAAPLAKVDDPTPNKVFTGTYTNADGTTGTQTGYVAVYSDGVVACNGGTTLQLPDRANPGKTSPAQGQAWVGPNHAAKDTSAGGAAPGNVAGAGNNQTAKTGAYCE